MTQGPIKLAFAVLMAVGVFMGILSIQYLDNVAEKILAFTWFSVTIVSAYYYAKKEPDVPDIERHLNRRRETRRRARRRRD